MAEQRCKQCWHLMASQRPILPLTQRCQQPGVNGELSTQEGIMASMRIDYTTMEWSSAVPFYGPAAVYDGKDIVQLKVLSDRRKEGGGIAWLVKMTPPPGKLIKIVAVALSDEHIFSLQGGRSTKSGERAQGAGGYGLNPKGQPHSAMIAQETMALVIYAGEPDEIRSMEVVDVAEAA
jgi:hypothetical protein